MKVKKFIILTILFEKEEGGDRWTAECRELGTSTFGDTLEEAKGCIEEAILLHLNTLEEVGECERFLRENKIEVRTKPIQDGITIEAPNDPRVFSQPLVMTLPKLQDA